MKNNGWKSYLCLEIVEKNEQICTVKFQNFLREMPPEPHTGEGLRRPSPDPVPRSGQGPLHCPSLCAVYILRYFRPWRHLAIRSVSVCLSICPSHAGHASKLTTVVSRDFHRRVARDSSFMTPSFISEVPENLLERASDKTGVSYHHYKWR